MAGARIGIALIAVAIAAPVAAQQRSAAIRTAAFEIDFTALRATGNTETSLLGVAQRLNLRTADDGVRFGQLFRTVRSEAEGVEGADSYKLRLNLDYRVARGAYLGAVVGWERDLRSGLDHRWRETILAAYELNIAQADFLRIEAGFSAFQQRDAVEGSSGLSGSTTAAHLAGRFWHIFSKGTYFTQSVELAPNLTVGGGFRTIAESEASAKVTNLVSLKLVYHILSNNRPALDQNSGRRLKKTDRLLMAGISFLF